MKMVYPSHLLIFITILSFFAIYTSAAPTSFAEVEESWQRGLSEVFSSPRLIPYFPSALCLTIYPLFPSPQSLSSILRLFPQSIPKPTLIPTKTERNPQRNNTTPHTIVPPSLPSSPPSTHPFFIPISIFIFISKSRRQSHKGRIPGNVGCTNNGCEKKIA
jgi:hypothetical protein